MAGRAASKSYMHIQASAQPQPASQLEVSQELYTLGIAQASRQASGQHRHKTKQAHVCIHGVRVAVAIRLEDEKVFLGSLSRRQPVELGLEYAWAKSPERARRRTSRLPVCLLVVGESVGWEKST